MRSPASPLIQERNQAIFDRYSDLYFKQLLREEAIWPVLKKEFWLEKNTIYKIVLEMSKK